MLWLADITTRAGNQHYFAEDQVSFAGNAYLPYLRILSGPRLSRSLRADAGEIELLNTDLVVGTLLQAEPFEGARCELKQLLLGLDDAVVIFRARLSEQEESDLGVRFRLVSELDPAQIDIHTRLYAQLCTWQFARPGRLTPCGYQPVGISDVAEALFGERAADIFSSTTIGDSTLTEPVNAHQNRIVILTAGTGRGQKRRILSNTATAFSLYHPWGTAPDASSRFRVFVLPNGAPKLLLTSASGKLEGSATAATARSLTDSTLAMQVDEHQDDLVAIVGGAAFGQTRKIGSNTATTLILADDQPDFDPAPNINDKFRLLYRTCHKDFAPSCEDRGRTHAFNGFPTLVPLLRRHFGGRFTPGGIPRDLPLRRRWPIDPQVF